MKIVSSWRSGSTFTSSLLRSHQETFYHDEPLRGYGYVRINDKSSKNYRNATQQLSQLFYCNYTNMGKSKS